MGICRIQKNLFEDGVVIGDLDIVQRVIDEIRVALAEILGDDEGRRGI